MVADPTIHIGSMPDPATLDSVANFICGDDTDRYPIYRSSSALTRFFQSTGIDRTHDGSTRKWWVLGVLQQLQPSEIEAVILRLVDLREYKGDKSLLGVAVRVMNAILSMESLEIHFHGARPGLKRGKPINLDQEELLSSTTASDESEFLSKQFTEQIHLRELGLDSVITTFLQARVDEVQSCPRAKVPLGTIFLLGSTLEGLLLAIALEHPIKFMSAGSAPKGRSTKPKPLHEWSLSELINVAYELSLLDLDVSKFSHILRGFRNYIHPYRQMSEAFSPDQNTADICWQVFKAAYSQIKDRARKTL